MNISTLADYSEYINIYANIRDYLIRFTTNLLITTVDSIILQSSTLAQLTNSTNQLTRTALV